MAEDIKSAMHDATPSWNGFSYQGKVGLYVCLKLIQAKLEEHDIQSQCFSDFLESYSIEYEWIEDFSIKENEQYVSLHQVKHKAGSSFADHISAIVTILNRRLCRISETDYIKYDTSIMDYDDCATANDRNIKKLNYVQTKLNLLLLAGYIDADNKLTANWRDIQQEVEGISPQMLQALLDDFETFSSNTFANSKIYFHTAEIVNLPNKDIEKYEGIPPHHKASVRGLRTLSGLDIYLDFDNPVEYSLSLSDASLIEKINELIEQILQFTLPNENFSEDDVYVYRAALNQVIDGYISSRHADIREKRNLGFGFVEQRASLKFSNLIEPLMKLIQHQGKEYWEKFCAISFESAFDQEVARLNRMIQSNTNTALNQSRKENLENYRNKTLVNYSYTELLQMLRPNVTRRPKAELREFFDELSNKSTIVSVFLKFVRELASCASDFIVRHDNYLAFYPSAIEVKGSDVHERKDELEQVRYGIAKNTNLFELAKASHLLIDIDGAYDLTNERVELLSVAERIDAEKTENIQFSITDVDSILFESVDAAIRTLK